MVNGVLYLWVRNAGNAQLAWSRDRGQTWSWSDWTFTTSFGAPTFLNFGCNYAGARDDLVYVYSHDSDSAYQPADRMVLARASSRIRDRQAYEFFKGSTGGVNRSGRRRLKNAVRSSRHPRGVTDLVSAKRRGCAVTSDADAARRRALRGEDSVYDAPEPWGPTTVFFTERWDVGPGETSSFPTKWMSADGRTMHLVFSGDDAFSVRKATIK